LLPRFDIQLIIFACGFRKLSSNELRYQFIFLYLQGAARGFHGLKRGIEFFLFGFRAILFFDLLVYHWNSWSCYSSEDFKLLWLPFSFLFSCNLHVLYLCTFPRLYSGAECGLSINGFDIIHHYFRAFQLRCESQTLYIAVIVWPFFRSVGHLCDISFISFCGILFDKILVIQTGMKMATTTVWSLHSNNSFNCFNDIPINRRTK
jgi:hypothetical protein